MKDQLIHILKDKQLVLITNRLVYRQEQMSFQQS